MNNSQRAAAERLAKALQNYGNEQEEAAELLRELAAEPVQEATPDDMKVYDAIAANYAAPQQPMRCPTDGGECGAGGYCRPEPQQRRPLTDKDIVALLAWDDYLGGCITLLEFARAIERAHGITGEPT